MNSSLQDNRFLKSILVFFVFGSLFPSIHVLLYGTGSSLGVFELFVGLLPEFFSLCILGILVYFLIKHSNSSLSIYRFQVFDWIVLSFFIVNIFLGFVINDNFQHSFNAFRLTYFPVVFYFFGRFHLPIDKYKVYDFCFLIMYWLLGVALIGILLYFVFPNFMSRMIEWAAGKRLEYSIPRMTSLFWSPSLLAEFMSLGALFSFYNIQLKNGWRYYFLFFVFLLCLLFTVSRAPLLIFIMGILALTSVFKNWKALLICLAIIITSFFIAWLFVDSIDKSLIWIFSSTLDCISAKNLLYLKDLLLESLRHLKSNPLGVGFGKMETLTSDSWYLKITYETGIIGLLSYLFLVSTHGWMAYQYWKNYKMRMMLFLFLFFVLFNLESIVRSLPEYFLLSNFYWLSIGFAQNLIAAKKGK